MATAIFYASFSAAWCTHRVRFTSTKACHKSVLSAEQRRMPTTLIVGSSTILWCRRRMTCHSVYDVCRRRPYLHPPPTGISRGARTRMHAATHLIPRTFINSIVTTTAPNAVRHAPPRGSRCTPTQSLPACPPTVPPRRLPPLSRCTRPAGFHRVDTAGVPTLVRRVR